MSTRKRLIIRLVLAGAFGMGVALVPLYLVVGGNGSFYITYPQFNTRRQLKKTDVLLGDYRAKNGVYPPTLDAAGLGFWHDGWGSDFKYSLPNGVPLVESLGRDGVRGGIGLDADLSNQHPSPPESVVPFPQKIFDPLARGTDIAALVCGVLAGIMFFQGLTNQSFERKAWPKVGLSLLLAFLVAACGAIFITSAHVPSGH
jgi:hypothetical protein